MALNTKIPRKVSRFIEKHGLLDDNATVVAVAGSTSSALLATEEYLLVVKVGFMAGSTGGGRHVALTYSEISGIQVQLGISMGTLSVQAPGYGATQTGDFWNSNNQQSWQNLPNVIAWSKSEDKKFKDELDYIRTRVREAKTPTAPPQGGQDPSQVAAELERMATLHESGHLSDEEFAAAKAKILGL